MLPGNPIREKDNQLRGDYLKQSVSRLVNILFPELETLVPTLHMVSVYAMLTEFPGAKQIANSHLTHFKAVLSDASNGRYDREKAVEIMKTKLPEIVLKPRTKENVIIYFNKTQDGEIRKFLPQKAKSEAEAIENFEKSLLPASTSYGRSIYAGSVYIGDIWAYCIGEEEPDAMLSFCVFDESMWGKGAATEAARLFITEIKKKYSLNTLGAFTYSENFASIKVLLRNGFQEKETFTEDGIESKYFQLDFSL